MKELGLWKQTVMYVAIQTELASLDPVQVKLAITCFKQANLEPQDIWLLLSKRMYLFKNPVQLQRWMDYLVVLKFGTRELLNFFMRAPEALLAAYTIHSASQVVKFLKEGLGMKDEHIAQRVCSISPSILMRSVDDDIKPIISLLISLGVEISDISGIICMWPELLMASAETQLKPWVQFMEELGCSRAQTGEVVNAAPYLLGSSATFKESIRALHMIGITKDDLHSITSRDIMWLKSASSVPEILNFLSQKGGFSDEQVRTLVLAAPGVLSSKPVDLERKWNWFEQVGATQADVLHCPQTLEVSLISTLGPRHGFLGIMSKRRQQLLQQQPRQEQLNRQPQKQEWQLQSSSIPTASTDKVLEKVQWPILVAPVEDGPWCEKMEVELMEYKEFRAKFEEEYLKSMTRSSAMEFQDELKRLGIYEGE